MFDGRTLYFVGCEKVRNEWVDGGGGAVGRGDSHRWDGLDRCTAACFGEVNVSQRPSSRGVSVEAHANHTARLHRYPGPITGQRDKAPLLYTKGRCPVLPTPPPVHASTSTPSPSSTTHHTHQSPCTIPIPASNAKSIHLTSPPPRRKHPDRAPGTRHPALGLLHRPDMRTYLPRYLPLPIDRCPLQTRWPAIAHDYLLRSVSLPLGCDSDGRAAKSPGEWLREGLRGGRRVRRLLDWDYDNGMERRGGRVW